MVAVPTLDRLTRMDVADRADPIRQMAIWQELCEEIEGAFTEIDAQQTTIAAVQVALDGKNTIFRATTAPPATATGDLWLDSDDGDKPYRWSGSAWVVVQDVGAAYARLGVNPDGTIANDKVVNDSVLAGAVISADAGYTVASTTITPYATWVSVGTKSFTSTGREVEVVVAARIQVLDNCKYQYRLLCDGVQVEDALGPITVSIGDQVPLSFAWAHTPTAAAHTYALEVQVNNNGITVHNALISPSENRNL